MAHVVPALYDSPSPLRTTHLRDPEDRPASFAVESFMDEIAAAAGADPVEFRLRYIQKTRAPRPFWPQRPKRPIGTSVLAEKASATRRYRFRARHRPRTRGGTYVGTIAEVEVNRRTGEVHVTRLVCAHDCGLIINPEALRGTIAANLMQSMSRALKEEVTFDRNNVTSVDWKTYPYRPRLRCSGAARYRPAESSRDPA